MSELLNRLLQDFVSEEESKDIDNRFIWSLQKIIASQKFSLTPRKCSVRVSTQKNQEYAHQFLRRLNRNYDDYFTYLLSYGRIQIHKRENPNQLSQMIASPYGKMIHIYETRTIEDAYTYVHEMMHDWNCIEFSPTETWQLMTECFSILAENLERDDMEKYNPPPEYRKNKIATYYALRERAVILGFELELIDVYFNHGYIDDDMLFQILDSKSGYEREVVRMHLSWIDENEELRFDSLQRDVIGGVMASYMHDRILEKPERVEEFIEFNNHCNEIPFLDLLRMLGLEVEDESSWILSEKSLQTLEKSYQKELKSL